MPKDKQLDVVDKIQILMESANYALKIYNDNIDNDKFTPELRQVMASNIITLSSMVEQSFSMMSLKSSHPKENELLEKHFDNFNELIWLNSDLIEKFFVEEPQTKKPKVK